jgi:hypothetical protein
VCNPLKTRKASKIFLYFLSTTLSTPIPSPYPRSKFKCGNTKSMSKRLKIARLLLRNAPVIESAARDDLLCSTDLSPTSPYSSD